MGYYLSGLEFFCGFIDYFVGRWEGRFGMDINTGERDGLYKDLKGVYRGFFIFGY